jgi:hypothetical protein
VKVVNSKGEETTVTFTASHSLDWKNPEDRLALAEAFGPSIMEEVLGPERLAADLAEALGPKDDDNPDIARPGQWETSS